MAVQRCRKCGSVIPEGERNCPQCGAARAAAVSRVWILAFFVMGVLVGLLILLLQQGGVAEWLSAQIRQYQPLSQQKVAGQVADRAPAGQDLPVQVEPMLCDRQSALGVWQKARGLASIHQRNGAVDLYLGRDWVYYSAGHQRGFVTAVADADRCLHGDGRTIRFFYQGEEVATVSRTGAVEIK